MPEDYVAYALKQLQVAVDKQDDAPASAAMHERQALFALAKKRIPTVRESLNSWESLIYEEDSASA